MKDLLKYLKRSFNFDCCHFSLNVKLISSSCFLLFPFGVVSTIWKKQTASVLWQVAMFVDTVKNESLSSSVSSSSIMLSYRFTFFTGSKRYVVSDPLSLWFQLNKNNIYYSHSFGRGIWLLWPLILVDQRAPRSIYTLVKTLSIAYSDICVRYFKGIPFIFSEKIDLNIINIFELYYVWKYFHLSNSAVEPKSCWTKKL